MRPVQRDLPLTRGTGRLRSPVPAGTLRTMAVSRRAVLRGLVGAGLAAGASACGVERLHVWCRPGVAGAPPPDGLHLQFGADAAREMVASWETVTPVLRPRLQLGTPADGYGRTIPAETRTYIDAVSGVETYTHHATMTGLTPGTPYVYDVLHDGVDAVAGTFRTAPAGRTGFRFPCSSSRPASCLRLLT